MSVDYDTVIVGGGIAGLYAALKILRSPTSKPHRLLLIEASSRLGGRIQTFYREGGLLSVIDAATHPPPGAPPPIGLAIRAASGILTQGIPLEAGAGRFTSKHKLLLDLIHHYDLPKYAITNEKNYSQTNKTNEPEPVIPFDKYHIPRPPASLNATFKEYCIQIIGPEATATLRASDGYNAEFDLMNAADAWRMFNAYFTSNTQFYVLPDGLSTLIHKMADEVRTLGGTILLKTKCQTFERGRPISIKLTDGRQDQIIQTKRLILALPQAALLALPTLEPIYPLLNTVAPVSLNRLYVKWRRHEWMNDIIKTTTDNHVRQFIPALNGIAQIYADTTDADYWKDNALKHTIKTHLREVFPGKPITLPEWVAPCYWKAGVHVWRPGTKSASLSKRIARPFGSNAPIYIVGEAYARNQGWVESALETVEAAKLWP